jgi:hypothetical protein
VQGEDRDPPGSYTRTNQQALDSVFDYLNNSRADQAARGSALHRIVQEERALRDKERTERHEKRRREREARRAAGDGSTTGAAQVEPSPQVDAADSSMDIAEKLAAEAAESDPFVDPARQEGVGTAKSAEDISGKRPATFSSSKSATAQPAQQMKKFASIRKVGSAGAALESAIADNKGSTEERKPRRRKLEYKPNTTADGGRGGASF